MFLTSLILPGFDMVLTFGERQRKNQWKLPIISVAAFGAGEAQSRIRYRPHKPPDYQ